MPQPRFTYWGNTQASMLLMEFKSRLKRLNPGLYVSDNSAKRQGLLISGIYLKQKKQQGLSYDTKGHGDAKVEKYFAELESGHMDLYLCGLCLEWLPEFDVFNAEYTNLVVPGWRTILMQLVTKKAITLDKARKVFECASLGEADYDRMSFFSKLAHAKKLDNIE